MFVLSRQFAVLKEIRFNNISDCIKKPVSNFCSLCNKANVPKRPVRRKEKIPKTLEKNSQPLFLHDSPLRKSDELFNGSYEPIPIKCNIAKEEIRRKYHEKVKALADYFRCSEDAAATLIQKYNFLLKSSMESITAKLEALLEGGITKEELLNDLWILTYTVPTIEERLDLLKELNLTPVKPWLLRCSSHMLLRMATNRENNRLAMGHYKNVVDYLKERLDMTDSQTIVFSKKHPPVMHVKVAKLKEMIDFLYSEGFKPIQIYHTPRILCHSVVTIKCVH